MVLLPEERAILYNSYKKVAAAGPVLTDLFYRHLFEIDPSLRELFPASMAMQGVKFRLKLNFILLAIDHPDNLAEILRTLGERHTGYGVKPEDYPKFAESVLWAVKQYLDVAYTPEVDAAWRKLFAVINELSTHSNAGEPA